MSKISNEWVRDQFTRSKIRVDVGMGVLDLLELTRDVEIPDNISEEVYEVFSKVSRGIALVEESDQTWVEAVRGELSVNDVVRVKVDGYTGQQGEIHNGRVGKIVAIRSGDIIVTSTDGRMPELVGTHYQPNVLEKRIS